MLRFRSLVKTEVADDLIDFDNDVLGDLGFNGFAIYHLDKGNALVVGMIDYGTCSIEHIQPCKDTFIDGIRVIFKEHLMYEALAFCKQIKSLGYKVFSQMVSVTT